MLLDPAVRDDPFEHYERMRTSRPFVGGAFARTSVHHDVCTAVLRSDDFGVVGRARAEGLPPVLQVALRLAGPRPSVGPVDTSSMLAVDPPEHTRYRRPVNRAFTARAVARLRERTREIADGLLDDLERDAAASGGRVDLVERYASLLPVTVISEMLGVPTAMREQFLAWADGAAPSPDLVILVLAAANRGPRVFDDPHTFDVTRANAREHVAFSSGIHFCLGAALARMEGEVALQALFERFPGLAPAGAPRRRGTTILRGYEALPVRLHPTPTIATDSDTRATRLIN